MRWCQLPASPAEIEQTARGIVETVTRFRQLAVGAPVLHAPIAPRDRVAGITQADKPVSFDIAPGRIVGTQLVDDSGRRLQLLLDDGSTIEIDEGVNARARRRVAAMDEATPKRRQPARVMSRLGEPKAKRKLDPLGGLVPLISEFGEVIWTPAPGGASIGILEMYEHGNTALLHRVSGDENDTLAGQFGPNLGLCRQHPDTLVPRYAIFAVHMSGTREYWPGMPEGIRTAYQREDLIQLDRWIQEGWVENVVARDDDRIAREMIWVQHARLNWRENGVALWLARFGRKMDYDKDRIALGAMALVAEEERVNVTRRMQAARIDKGPAIGLGWGTKPRIGFLKDDENGGYKQNLDQWPYVLRIFELADVDDANALSTDDIADELTRQGFGITGERVRTMLEDPIYATGEWTAGLRGTRIPQHPVELQNPVPIDRFQRIQDTLALRQGKSDVTPIGEFLLNYVEAVHTQCMDESRPWREKYTQRPLVKGYIDKREPPQTRRMFHVPYVPEACKGNGRGRCGAFSWQRHEIEPAIVAEVRRIAEHPELQRQFALAVRHQVASSSSRLSEAQRAECEHEIERLKRAMDDEMDRFVDGIAAGEPLDRADHDARVKRIRDRLAALERRIAADDEAAAREDPESAVPRDDQRRLRDFLEIMTVETPDDPFHKQLRARLFQRVIQRVEIDDSGTGPITITLYGQLVPETAPLDASNPVHACHDLLDAYAHRKARKNRAKVRSGEEGANPQTGTDKVEGMAVWGSLYSRLLDMPGGEKLQRQRRMAFESIAWRQRRTHQRKDATGLEYSWVHRFRVSAAERPRSTRRRQLG